MGAANDKAEPTVIVDEQSIDSSYDKSIDDGYSATSSSTTISTNVVHKCGMETSKEIIDFGLSGACPLKETVLDHIIISNHGTARMRYKFDPVPSDACKLIFSPPAGTLPAKKKGDKAVPPSKKIIVKLILLKSESLNLRVNLRVNTNDTLFLTIRAHPDVGVFGADPSTLDIVDSDGFRVPNILAQMKNYLVEKDALREEGVFRLAGDSTEMKIIKDQINQTKTFEGDANPDVHAIANLIKVWYRELPTPILNVLPDSVISQSADPTNCATAFQQLQEPQKTLLSWLIHMLVDVAAEKVHNKMSSQNLAIVVAPNLYDPPGSDPMEGLVMSQKAVQFLHNLIVAETEKREKVD